MFGFQMGHESLDRKAEFLLKLAFQLYQIPSSILYYNSIWLDYQSYLMKKLIFWIHVIVDQSYVTS